MTSHPRLAIAATSGVAMSDCQARRPAGAGARSPCGSDRVSVPDAGLPQTTRLSGDVSGAALRRMPDVKQQKLETAKETLQEKVGIINPMVDGKGDLVVSSHPAAGELVSPDTKVTLYLGSELPRESSP